MSNKHKKDSWENQTKIAEYFGLSSVKFGKFLVEKGLRDSETKYPTSKALSEGFAKSTPLKDGIPFFMWNKAKLAEFCENNGLSKLNKLDYYIKKTKKEYEQIQKNDDGTKIYSLMEQSLYDLDDVPKELREQVRKAVFGE